MRKVMHSVSLILCTRMKAKLFDCNDATRLKVANNSNMSCCTFCICIFILDGESEYLVEWMATLQSKVDLDWFKFKMNNQHRLKKLGKNSWHEKKDFEFPLIKTDPKLDQVIKTCQACQNIFHFCNSIITTRCDVLPVTIFHWNVLTSKK